MFKKLIAVFFFIVTLLGFSLAWAHMPTDSRLGEPDFFSSWKTLSTPHFNIHYQSQHLSYAQRMAAIAEQVYSRTTQWLEWEPSGKTEIVIKDTLDASNGGATPLPYNQFFIYMSPPVDGELLSDEPWIEMVFTHEFIHILHMDQARGFPGVMRKIFGRILFFFPQVFSPKWITEGLAVYGETELSAEGFGRGQSAFYEAMMRAEVMNGLRSQTELSYHGYLGTDWPRGQVYLYGYYFFEFIENTYGKDKVIQYIKNWNNNIVPWRMDARAKQVLGVSGKQLWVLYQQYLQKRFAEQIESLQQQRNPDVSLVAVQPYRNENPVWLENGDFYYARYDGRHDPTIVIERADGTVEKLSDIFGVLMFDVNEQRDVLMSRYRVCNNNKLYADLFKHTDGSSGWKRLTHCGRYIKARYNTSGDLIAAVQINQGKSSLVLLDDQGQPIRTLLSLNHGDAIGDMGWSSDDQRIVVAVKRQRNGWNLEIIDVATATSTQIKTDARIPSRPVFAHSDRFIYFVGEVDHLLNVQRLDLQTGLISTITSTVTAISDFSLSGDQQYLRYVEYTANGTQIKQMPLTEPTKSHTVMDEFTINERLVSVDIPPVQAFVNSEQFHPENYTKISNYQPFISMRPRSWWVWLYSDGEDNTAAQLVVDGSDALRNHFWQAAPIIYGDKEELGGDFAYLFNGRFGILGTRRIETVQDQDKDINRPGIWDIEHRYQALWMQPFNSLSHSFQINAGIGYEKVTRHRSDTDMTHSTSENLAGISLSWDTRELYTHSVTPEHGRLVTLSAERYGVLEDQPDGDVLTADWREYISLWNNNVLSLRWIEAEADQTLDPLQLGGFSDGYETIAGQIGFGRREFMLRGYDENQPELTGHRVRTLSAEWRMPIAEIYDGLLYPPVGLGKLALTLFADTGTAWEPGEDQTYYSSIGAEFRPEVLLGYDLLPLDINIGIAHGLDDIGKTQAYLRLGLGF